jgi:RNA polymerase sigma-70 factor (family 1)
MTMLAVLDEKELLIRLGLGDRKAFEEIYHKYKHHIFIKLMKLVRSEEIAEELLQEVFYKLWLNHQQLHKVNSFPAYLYRMAANLVADFYRKAALDKKMQEQLIRTTSELYNDVENTINFKESSSILDEAIASLSPQRQTIFKLCKIEGRSYEEVAHLLGISTSTINDHIVKATRSIKSKYASSTEGIIILITAYWLRH